MSQEYKKDRQWSDEIFYDKSAADFIYHINKSNIFGEVIDLVPASIEDDNIFNIDTHINGDPTQVRVQREKNKKSEKYNPTIRYGRPHDTDTEVSKMIKKYDEYVETGNIRLPKFLLWALVDEKYKVVNLKIINLFDLLSDRKATHNNKKDYRMKDDKDKFSYKENGDGTSFLIIETDKYTVYDYEL